MVLFPPLDNQNENNKKEVTETQINATKNDIFESSSNVVNTNKVDDSANLLYEDNVIESDEKKTNDDMISEDSKKTESDEVNEATINPEENNVSEQDDKRQKVIICKECKKEVSKKDKKCPHCGVVLNKGKKTVRIILILLALIVATIVGIVTYNYIEEQKKLEKYNEAISLYEAGDYEQAKQLFIELDYYEYSYLYIDVIEGISLLQQEKFGEALQIFESISDNDIVSVYDMKEYAEIGADFQNGRYSSIYEDNKYKSSFYNDKEKEMVYESFYQVGVSYYNQGKYTSAKEAFDKIPNYKDVPTILSDKYFGLIGNYYSYSTSYGYRWGLVGLLFYPHTDTVNYNVFVQSLFDTNIPNGNDYSYTIVNNVLYFGSSFAFRIISFDGNTLVVNTDGNTYTLTKN